MFPGLCLLFELKNATFFQYYCLPYIQLQSPRPWPTLTFYADFSQRGRQAENLLPRENLITAFSHLAARPIKSGLSESDKPSVLGNRTVTRARSRNAKGQLFSWPFSNRLLLAVLQPGTLMQMPKLLGLFFFFPFK